MTDQEHSSIDRVLIAVDIAKTYHDIIISRPADNKKHLKVPNNLSSYPQVQSATDEISISKVTAFSRLWLERLSFANGVYSSSCYCALFEMGNPTDLDGH